MKLLFDANLSPRLVRKLREVYPGSSHVSVHPGLQYDDRAIWQHAQKLQFAVVSKDNDFAHLSMLYGPPPKVVLLAVGNATTKVIEKLMLRDAGLIGQFIEHETTGLLILRP